VASFEDGRQISVLFGGCQNQNIIPGPQPDATFVRHKLAIPHDEADPGIAGEVGQVRYGAAVGR